MKSISIETSITGSLEPIISLATRALQREGFGVLSKIDLHKKFQEALGKVTPPTVILGACSPALALKAMELNPDFALFLPCNVVIRELGENRFSVAITRPTALASLLADPRLSLLAQEADSKLETVVSLIDKSCSQNKAAGSKASSLEEAVEEDCWDRDMRWNSTENKEQPISGSIT